MYAESLITELAQQTGLSSLKLDEHGLMRLVFEHEIVIDIEYVAAENTIHLYGVLMTMDHQPREALYERLLEANLFTDETAGATIGLDKTTHEVLITRRLELDTTDFTEFSRALQGLVSALHYWRDALTQTASGVTLGHLPSMQSNVTTG